MLSLCNFCLMLLRQHCLGPCHLQTKRKSNITFGLKKRNMSNSNSLSHISVNILYKRLIYKEFVIPLTFNY